MTKKNDKIEVNVDMEFRAAIGRLILERIDSPDKMENMPSLLVTMMSVVVGALGTVGASKEEAVTFVQHVAEVVYEAEENKVEAARRLADVLDAAEDDES